MRKYELMAILPAEADEARVGAAIERVSEVLGDRGKVGEIDRWGKRRLAHQIAGHTDGYYLVARIDADPEAIGELQRALTLSDEIVRFKVVLRAA